MPKVVDAARVTTPTNTVWRTCTGCDRLRPLPDGVDRCDDCTTTTELPRSYAQTGWDIATGFAELVGAITAWAEQVPGRSDAERLAEIRHLLKTLNPLRPDGEVK